MTDITSNDCNDDRVTGSLKGFQIPSQKASRTTISGVGLHTHISPGAAVYTKATAMKLNTVSNLSLMRSQFLVQIR